MTVARDNPGRGSLYVAVLIAITVVPTVVAQDDSSALAVLEDRGLVRLGQGKLWITRREAILRRRFAALPGLREQVAQEEKRLGEMIVRNQQLWSRREAAERELRDLERRSQADSRRGKELQQLVQGLEKQAVKPDALCARAEARQLAVRLTNLRNTLALALLWIRESFSLVPREYDRLRTDKQITQALERLGKPARLGPAKSYRSEWARLAEYEKVVFTPSVPLYRESGRFRVGGIVNEKVPVMFTWRVSSEPVWITSNMLQAVGLTVPADAPRTMLTVAPGRRLSAARITLGSIRFGSRLLRDVEALVLPPEGEDLGAQIGPAALEDYRARVLPARLSLALEQLR